MDLDEYQANALSTALPAAVSDTGITYATLGLNGEAGEVAEKVKKAIRDHEGTHILFHDDEVAKELGDVLWYVAILAWNIGYPLEQIGQMNVDKLASRKQREVLTGSGDER